jgi:hypothetical protein
MQKSIQNAINHASKAVSTYWPLHAFITVNPLWDMTDESFASVIQQINDRPATMPQSFYLEKYEAGEINNSNLEAALKFHGHDRPLSDSDIQTALFKQNETNISQAILYAQQINEFNFHQPLTWIQEQCNHWLLQYFGKLTQSPSSINSQNLEDFWKGYVINEHKELEQHFNKSNNTTELIESMLKEIGVPESQLTRYFKEIFFQQYGWSSLIKWIRSRPDNPWLNTTTNLESILLMWVSYEWLVFNSKSESYKEHAKEIDNELPILSIWQSAYEYNLHDQLLEKLKNTSNSKEVGNSVPETQWVFCIDTRSEGIRRHIESISNHQTFGFAGFFGFAFKFKDGKKSCYQSPAILDPADVVEVNNRNISLEKPISKSISEAIDDSKNHLSAPFALFEMFGIFKLYKLLKKTFIHKENARHTHKEYDVSQIDDEAAANSALGFLSTIGLTKEFAQEVIICGHQSVSDNNPYAAGLDCGACGGNSGIPNATIAVQLLNKPEVRSKLSEKGIVIPESTKFIAACHFTTHDNITFLNDQPSEKTVEIAKLAAENLSSEKAKGLVYQENSNMIRKETDWADLIPETGLANNYALIIGPRKLSKHANLDRRTFLHSYEPDSDPNGEILAGIIAAPVVVAHWINSQYYFSTVNQLQFGAGNKAIHNVIPGIGVMEGNLSDLKIGLPQQSVSYQQQLIHEPRKLLVVIYGNKAVIEKTVSENEKVNQLITGGWLTLKIIETN